MNSRCDVVAQNLNSVFLLHFVWYTILKMKGHYVHQSHVMDIVDMPAPKVCANRTPSLGVYTSSESRVILIIPRPSHV